jgi:rubrerythrin
MKSWRENPDGQENQLATKQIEREIGGMNVRALVLDLGHAKSNDAHCLACGFKMLGGANVGLCPKCGSGRWYRTKL